MDKDKIRKAIDSFEEDKFSDSKDILSGEIRNTRDTYIKDKLGLEKDINPKKKEE